MQAAEGTLISYATQPGNVAQDGADGNSPYTKALVASDARGGARHFSMCSISRTDSQGAHGGSQQPWVSSSPIEGQFFFVPPGSTVTITTLQKGLPRFRLMRSCYIGRALQAATNPAEFQAYLKKFPNGQFAIWRGCEPRRPRRLNRATCSRIATCSTKVK